MPLSQIAITNHLAWLPENTSGATATVQGLPAGYGACLKLLLPLGIDSSVPVSDYSFARSTVAELNG